MAIIKVTLSDLREKAREVERLKGEYENYYNEFYTKVKAMTDWKDDTNQAYIDQVEGFRDNFESVITCMETLQQHLTNTANGYQQTSENLTAEAKKLAN